MARGGVAGGDATGGGVKTQPITTGRLELLPLRVEHADEMASVLADPALYAFIGGSPPAPAELRARYERQLAGSGDPGVAWLNWVVRLRDEGWLAGTVQATVAVGEPRTAEIAWVIGTWWQGRGIATEAARALVAWLRSQGVRTLVAHVHPDHAASAAVAAAAGLTPTDQWHDGEIRWQLDLEPEHR